MSGLGLDGCKSTEWVTHSLSSSMSGRSLLVLVWKSRGSSLTLSELSVCVCKVLNPADASEAKRSDLRHVPGAKVKGRSTQTYPEKLSVRTRQGPWDHLADTRTRNIAPHTVFSLLALLPVLLLMAWFLPCEHIIHPDSHWQTCHKQYDFKVWPRSTARPGSRGGMCVRC